MRAIFFDEDEAAAVVARLLNDGFEARAERERLSGEDDDEGHPWAVVSDAPEYVLEILVEEFDGWLDFEASVTPTAPPLVLPPLRILPDELPSAPRRIKRPDLLDPPGR